MKLRFAARLDGELNDGVSAHQDARRDRSCAGDGRGSDFTLNLKTLSAVFTAGPDSKKDYRCGRKYLPHFPLNSVVLQDFNAEYEACAET